MAADVVVETKTEEVPQTRKEVIASALDAAEKAAVAEAAKEAPPSKDSKETKEEKKEPEKKEEKQKTEEELLQEQGLELIRALRDPERAPGIIEYLAKSSGYTKAEINKAST